MISDETLFEQLSMMLPNLDHADKEYADAVLNSYKNFIHISELPDAFQLDMIDKSRLPRKVNSMYLNSYELIANRHNIMFNFEDYKDTGFIASMLINQYYRVVQSNDSTVEQVLYIDTNLLLKDYKKMIDINSSDSNLTTVHSKMTLNNYIESVPVVIWDKYTMINSAYDRSKIYDLILTRYRRNLGNIFFIKGGLDSLSMVLDKEILNVMNLDCFVDCKTEVIPLIERDKEQLKW